MPILTLLVAAILLLADSALAGGGGGGGGVQAATVPAPSAIVMALLQLGAITFLLWRRRP